MAARRGGCSSTCKRVSHNISLSDPVRYVARWALRIWTKSARYIACYIDLNSTHCSV